jgi:Fe-S cluster biogenesis protein NfuA
MMARICDVCQKVIEQKNDEYIQLEVRVLNVTKSDDQDEEASIYMDACDGCIASGAAVTQALKGVNWTLEPKEKSA